MRTFADAVAYGLVGAAALAVLFGLLYGALALFFAVAARAGKDDRGGKP